jgi:hypothetical protein
MFRIFLGKKLASGKTKSKEKLPKLSHEDLQNRNRRLFERYNIQHYHLTLLNDQDILLLRDISAKGLSSEVSERTYLRFSLGDVYSARMRHLGELYEIKIKVSWKKDRIIGFEIVGASSDFLGFLGRIIRAMKIASSLREVDSRNLSEDAPHNRTWLRGEMATDLYIWKNSLGSVEAWHLFVGDEFVLWSGTDGFVTGQTQKSSESEAIGLPQSEPVYKSDKTVHLDRKRLAIDIIAALPIAYRDDLIMTLN